MMLNPTTTTSTTLPKKGLTVEGDVLHVDTKKLFKHAFSEAAVTFPTTKISEKSLSQRTIEFSADFIHLTSESRCTTVYLSTPHTSFIKFTDLQDQELQIVFNKESPFSEVTFGRVGENCKIPFNLTPNLTSINDQAQIAQPSIPLPQNPKVPYRQARHIDMKPFENYPYPSLAMLSHVLTLKNLYLLLTCIFFYYTTFQPAV